MFIVSSNITIGEWFFDYVVDVEIVQDIDTLTDTCKITIPRKTSWDGQNIAIGDDPIIKRGDKVVVKLGYDGNLKTRFIGYVKEVKAGMPVTLLCEDSMFLFKKLPKEKEKHTFTFNGGDIRDLLNVFMSSVIDPDTQIPIKYRTPANIALPPLMVDHSTPAEILEKVKSLVPLNCYFRNITTKGITESILYVGLRYWVDNRNTETFEFGFNILDPYELIFRRKEDIRLKVRAVSIQRNNTRIEIEVGDQDGEKRMVNRYLLNVDQLRIYALHELERFKYTGYHGSLETFGEPAVEKNDIINLVGNQYHPDGKYLAKEVRIKSGVGGYRQIIFPGPTINDTTNSTSTPS